METKHLARHSTCLQTRNYSNNVVCPSMYTPFIPVHSKQQQPAFQKESAPTRNNDDRLSPPVAREPTTPGSHGIMSVQRTCTVGYKRKLHLLLLPPSPTNHPCRIQSVTMLLAPSMRLWETARPKRSRTMTTNGHFEKSRLATESHWVRPERTATRYPLHHGKLRPEQADTTVDTLLSTRKVQSACFINTIMRKLWQKRRTKKVSSTHKRRLRGLPPRGRLMQPTRTQNTRACPSPPHLEDAWSTV